MNRRFLSLLFLSVLLLAPVAIAAPQAPPGDGPLPDASAAEPAPPPASSSPAVPNPFPSAPGPREAAAPTFRSGGTRQEATTPYLAPQWGAGVRLGPRYVWARNAGLDPFAKNDLVIGFQLEGMVRIWHKGPLSAWFLGGWSTGGMASNAMAREMNSSLLFHDLQVGLEGHYARWNRVTLQARIAPGAHYIRTRLTSTDLPYDLVAKNWTWSLDASAGASLLLGAVGDDEWPSARLWLSAEGGYTMTGKVGNKLEADIDDEEERARHGVTTLPSFNLSGVMFRATFGVTF